MNNTTANQVLNFVGKYLAIAVIVYFGWKLGAYLDGLIPL